MVEIDENLEQVAGEARMKDEFRSKINKIFTGMAILPKEPVIGVEKNSYLKTDFGVYWKYMDQETLDALNEAAKAEGIFAKITPVGAGFFEVRCFMSI